MTDDFHDLDEVFWRKHTQGLRSPRSSRMHRGYSLLKTWQRARLSAIVGVIFRLKGVASLSRAVKASIGSLPHRAVEWISYRT